jgi:hypothetical protein
MNRILPAIKWTLLGLFFFIAISLWVCLWLIPLNLATGKKNLGQRYAEGIEAKEIHRLLPESRNIVPNLAKQVKYQSQWAKEFELEGSQIVQYELSDEDFQKAVRTSRNLIKITSPMTFEEIDMIVSNGWYRRDERNNYHELVVFDQNRKQVWRYLKTF